jgi:hypothetical protein
MIQKNLKSWKEEEITPEELGPTITKAEFEEKTLNKKRLRSR